MKPKASPLLHFDFVEICGGVDAVSEAARGLGLSVAPPLDLSASRHYDLTDFRLIEWIIYMIEQRRFPAFLLEPPCTTFSPAAHPCLRSYKLPYLVFVVRTRALCMATVWLFGPWFCFVSGGDIGPLVDLNS